MRENRINITCDICGHQENVHVNDSPNKYPYQVIIKTKDTIYFGKSEIDLCDNCHNRALNGEAIYKIIGPEGQIEYKFKDNP